MHFGGEILVMHYLDKYPYLSYNLNNITEDGTGSHRPMFGDVGMSPYR